MKNKITKKKDKEWSLAIRERDNYTCQMCGNKGKFVHAHHIIPKQFREIRHNLDNGITLCYSCHKVGKFSPHQNALYFSKWLKENRPKKYDLLLKLVLF